MNKTGYIYSLTCNNPNLIYYGSTINQLNERLSKHKYDFKNNNCVSSKILFEWGNVKINMIEEIEFEDKKELLDRESYYIKNLKCVNKEIPNRSKKEYYCDNRKKILTHCKEYYGKNKEKIKKREKKYYEKNKEKKKQYFIDNKEKINEKKKKKITCDCGSEVRTSDISKHKKSQKHKVYEFLKEIEESNINLVV